MADAIHRARPRITRARPLGAPPEGHPEYTLHRTPTGNYVWRVVRREPQQQPENVFLTAYVNSLLLQIQRIHPEYETTRADRGKLVADRRFTYTELFTAYTNTPLLKGVPKPECFRVEDTSIPNQWIVILNYQT